MKLGDLKRIVNAIPDELLDVAVRVGTVYAHRPLSIVLVPSLREVAEGGALAYLLSLGQDETADAFIARIDGVTLAEVPGYRRSG